MNEFLQTICGTPLSGAVAAVAALLAAFGLGRTASAALKVEWRHPAFRDLALCVLGLDLFALLSVAISFTKAEACLPYVLWAVMTPFSICGIWHLRRCGRLFRKKSLIPVLALLLPFGFCSAAALCPPVGWDELVYQIAVPWRWLSAGHAGVQPDLPYSGFPALPQFLYWPLLGAGGAISAKALSFAVFALLAAAVFLLCKTRCSSGSATVLTLAFILSPIVNGLSKEAYAEQFIAANLAAALLLLKGLSKKRGLGAWGLAFAGIFAGAASAVKLTGGFVSVAAIAVALFSKGLSRRTILPLLLAAVLFPVPFYLRPALETGNPLHPYFAGLFASSGPMAESSSYHHAIGSEKYGADGVAGFLLTPFMLAIPSLDKINDGSYGLQSLLLLIFAALSVRNSLFSWGTRGFLRSPKFAFALSAAFLYVAWFLTARQARFLLPAFLLLLPLSSGFLAQFSFKLRASALAALLILSILSFPPKALKHFPICWSCATGRISQADFIYTGTGEGYLHAVAEMSSATPSGARPLLLFEERTLYMPRDCRIGTPFFQASLLTPPDAVGPQALAETLSNSGFTHLLARSPKDSPDLLPKYIDRCMGLANAAAFLEGEKFLKPIWRGEGGYVLFEIARGAQK